jgi:fructokinase
MIDEPLVQAPARFGGRALSGLILTFGEHGARLHTGSGKSSHVRPKHHATVVDSVGAGDAFSAVMILGIVERWPLEVALARAQDFASAIVGQRGATVPDSGFYQRLLDDWG